jgi:hypothetical protein
VSLAIDVDLVEAVLLSDGWHPVADHSFTVDAYEFVWWPSGTKVDNDDPTMLHRSGDGSVPGAGFSFHDRDDMLVSGPLTAVCAVRHRRD